MKHCLLVVDMQKGIFELKQPVYDKVNIVRNVKLAAEYAREKGIKVFYSRHENSTFLKRGTDGCEIIDDLKTHEDDIVIAKKHPDIFKDSEFDEVLKREGISSIIIMGLISNGCVRAACLSAMQRDYNVILLSDAYSTFSKDAEKIIGRTNREMEEAGVRIMKANELNALL